MDNKLTDSLAKKDISLLGSYKKSRELAEPFLEKYQINFPEYTDHGIKHSDRVSFFASEILKVEEIDNLTGDEIYVLLMGCLLHDIGMAISKEKIEDHIRPQTFHEFFERYSEKSIEDFIREFHHELSYSIIKKDYEKFGIISDTYAEAIALLAKSHRDVDLNNYDIYKIKFFVKSGSDFICIPYLGCVLRISDELDITKNRISELVLKYYPPNDDISKMEIEKHRSNMLVNFDGDTVVITAKCTNQYIYNALQSLYTKIKQEIKDCQKVIRNVGKVEEKQYLLSIRKLKSNVETIGFLPKDIGFSIDIEGVYTHFIGQSLYREPIIAIREALQNSIDTCRYKNICTSDYSPEINVILNEGKIIIEDNGIGMDEFIIKEFFGKLGSSIYKSVEVETEFESIAEFGIGIFSYFLICDYFEVETMIKGQKSIKFKVNKDPKLNFYFYKDFFKKDEGTKIIFYLNKFLKTKMTFQYLINSIKKFVKDIEFPINVIFEEQKEVIAKAEYKIDAEKELNKILTAPFFDKKPLLNLVSVKIDTNQFRGILGIWLPIDDSHNIYRTSTYEWFKRDSIKQEISHKGIFVKNYLRNSILKDLTGKINILKKIDLNLSRDSIIDKNLENEIVKEFENEIIKLVFKRWKNGNDYNKFLNLNTFCDMYIEDHYLTSIQKYFDIKKILKKFLYFKVFSDGDINYINSHDFLKKNNQYIIIPVKNIFREIKNKVPLERIYKNWKLPIIFTDYFFSLFHFFIILNKSTQIELSFENSFPYLIIQKVNKIVKENKFYDMNIIKFHNNALYSKLTFHQEYLNESHPWVNFLLKNRELIENNMELKEYFDYFFNDFNHKLKNLDLLNEILTKINKIMGTHFIITKEDFPRWLTSFGGELL